jgi:hypothetical protein
MSSKLHITDPYEAWNLIKNNWIIQVTNKSITACVVISILCIAWRWWQLPPVVPLWYSRPWGLEQLASPFWLFLLPLGGLVIYFINLTVSIYITAQYLIFTQMLFLSSLLVNILSLVTLIKILFLVT